jgi:hypothetical protein
VISGQLESRTGLFDKPGIISDIELRRTTDIGRPTSRAMDHDNGRSHKFSPSPILHGLRTRAVGLLARLSGHAIFSRMTEKRPHRPRD